MTARVVLFRRPTASAVDPAPAERGKPPASWRSPRWDTADNALADVWQQRRDLWARDYRPVAVYSPGAEIDGKPVKGAGKRPYFNDWIGLARRNPPDAVTRSPSVIALNTGILTGALSVFDIDVLLPPVTGQIVALIERKLGPTLLHRVGRPPRVALCYHTYVPFTKVGTPIYTMPDGSEAQVEVLGVGQNVVAFGVHPDTKLPYEWPQRSPLEVPLRDLPVVTAQEAQEVIDEAEAILRDAGGILVEKPNKKKDANEAESRPSPLNGRDQPRDDTNGIFRTVNDTALANRAAWVTALHPAFRDRGNSGWRLSSKDLGRDLQEDIAVHRTGIMDWGERVGLTAIDLVIKLGGAADAGQAALWLCERLGVDPADLGWRSKRSQQRQQTDPTDPLDDLGEWDYGAADINPENLPPRGWLLGSWLCRQFLSSLFGDGAVGKTANRIACALALCTGRDDIIGEHVFEPCNVLFLSFEDGEVELKRRIVAAQLRHKVSNQDLAGRLYVKAITKSQIKLAVTTRHGEYREGPLKDMLRTTIQRRRIDAVFLDPLIKTHALSENDNNAMDYVAEILIDLAVEFDIAVDAPHHIAKGKSEAGNADAGRGASAIKDGGRLVYTQTLMSETEAREYGIDPEERWQYVRIDKGKVNIVPRGGKPRWLRLVGVKLDNRLVHRSYPKGDEVQTVAVWNPPLLLGNLTNWTIAGILDRIDNGFAPGRLFSGAPQATHRGAWRVILEFTSEVDEKRAKAIIRLWIKDGVLVEDYYHDPVEGEAKGVRVSKRPASDVGGRHV